MKGVQWPILFLALFAAVVIKLAVHEEEQIGERVVEAQVTYRPPQGRNVVSYDKVQSVKVGVRGKSTELVPLSVFTVEVTVDIPPDEYGSIVITLTPANVVFRTVGDFDVLSIEPNRFTIQVEPRSNATVRVQASLMGEPAAGARYDEPVVRPAWVAISGPESLVRQVSAVTAPVSLDGHARTFEDSVPVTPPDPLIQVEPARVLVKVPMEEPLLSIDLGSGEESPPSGDEDGEVPGTPRGER